MTRVRLSSVLRPLILALCLTIYALQPAGAQQAAPAPVAAPSAGMNAAELNALADQLENGAARRRLVETLRALSAAQEAQPAAAAETRAAKVADAPAPATPAPAAADETEDPGAEIVDSIVAQMRRASSSVAVLGTLFSDLPSLQRWFELQVENPQRRALWADVLLKLGASLLVAIGLQAAAFIAVRRSMMALAPRGTGPVWLGLMFMLLRMLVALVPTAVFAAAAYGTLALLAPNALTRDLAQIVVLAFVGWRGVDIARQLLLAPDAVLARLLRLDGESAAYLQVWLRRLTAVGIFGYSAVRIAERVRIPADGIDAIARLAAFIFAVLLVVLVLQNRSTVADGIRGNDDSAGQGARAAGLRVLRHRLADTWHVLALLYIGASYFGLGIRGDRWLQPDLARYGADDRDFGRAARSAVHH